MRLTSTPAARRASFALITLLVALGAVGCGDEGGGDAGSDAGLIGSNTTAADAGDTSSMGGDASTTGDTSGDTTGGGGGFVFEGEQVACAENTQYEAQRAILAGGKNNPTGRGEQGGVFDPCNNRVILFGGNDRQPEECDSFGPKNYVGDTWAYSLEFENWYRINTATAPSSRGRHAAAFDVSRKQMIIFGGRYREDANSGLYELYNDLWAFDINTDTWEQLQPQGEVPPARTNSAMVYDPTGDRMILFGGNTSNDGLRFTPLNDTWILDLETRTWSKLTFGAAPTARLFHAMALDSAHNKVLVYSGGDENAFFGPFISDVWALDLTTLAWEQLWEARSSSGDAPAARINAVLMDDPERSRVVMFGGHDDTSLGNSNDLWAFDSATAQWSVLRPGDVYTGAGCPSFCQCAEDFVEYDLESPERRQYHTLVPIPDQSTAILFGGTGDCGYIDDTWHLDLANATWLEVHAPEQGVACARTGRELCEELCF